ncbi:hypothetical protein [Ochrobactrum sp. A-1]|uniref:hypothetical protein n=1 Tax=Ochrobactrum sp. A-1 TaxID=2920940 RepID=UPI001F0ACD22|nr:hypothetical protein [Ochrobactrum sp. A-1]
MANTANYNWPLPSPSGIQMNEVAKTATSFTAIDAKIKAFETSFSNHKHRFADLEDKPTTLGGYGITDGMTAAEVAQAIKTAVDDLINGSGAALDTLKELADALNNDPEFATTVGNALGVRVRVDAPSAFTAAQKAQGRTNLDALGTVDKGKADGVASLDSTGKVPSTQLPDLTTTATVGAAMAGANGKTTPADGDLFAGVEAGGSTMFKTTWGNIKTAITALVNTIVSGNMAGRAYPRRQDGGALNFIGSGVTAGQPPALIGGGWDGNFNDFYYYSTATLNVGWANGAGYADALGAGKVWTVEYIQNQLNWRVTDTRFAGYFEQAFNVAAASWELVVPGAPGYVVAGLWTWAPKNLSVSFRQPQIFIPNVGWRALGTW